MPSSQTTSIFTFGRKSTTYSAPRYSSVWPFLAAESLGLDHGEALQTHLVQRLLHLVELERFDHRFDFLHHAPPGPWHLDPTCRTRAPCERQAVAARPGGIKDRRTAMPTPCSPPPAPPSSPSCPRSPPSTARSISARVSPTPKARGRGAGRRGRAAGRPQPVSAAHRRPRIARSRRRREQAFLGPGHRPGDRRGGHQRRHRGAHRLPDGHCSTRATRSS